MIRVIIAVTWIVFTTSPVLCEELYNGAVRTYFDSETIVSGDAQSDTVQIPRASFIRKEPTYNISMGDRNMELKALRFYERSDEPCAVTVITALYMVGETEHSWDECNGRARSEKEIAYWFINNVETPQGASSGMFTYEPDGVEPSVDHDAVENGFLTAIRVCHTNDTSKRPGIVKGVEAEWTSHAVAPQWAEVDSPLPWNRRYATDKFSRTNCRGNWQEWARCPFNTVALALKLHHKALGGRRALTGISLKCHRMRSVLGYVDSTDFSYFDYHPVQKPGGNDASPPKIKRPITKGKNKN